MCVYAYVQEGGGGYAWEGREGVWGGGLHDDRTFSTRTIFRVFIINYLFPGYL